MDRFLYVSMTGAKQNMVAQEVHANNLANISTTGFRKDFAQARAMQVYGPGQATRAYALTERPATDFQQGTMQQTGRDLDVAIRGEGWITVQAPNGDEALTRAGDLQIDVNGILRTGVGYPVLGNGGPISIPEAEKIEIGTDGTISIRAKGQGPDVLTEVNRIKLVNPDPATLRKGVDGLIRADGEGVVFDPDATIQIHAGFIEGSNVNAVESMTEIISLARQFELQVKMMQEAEQKTESMARLLRVQ